MLKWVLKLLNNLTFKNEINARNMLLLLWEIILAMIPNEQDRRGK